MVYVAQVCWQFASRIRMELQVSKLRVRGIFIKGGRNGAVGIATRYGLDGLGLESRWRRDFPHPSKLQVPSWSCLQAVSKPVWHTPNNSWWWTEKLSETCRVSFQEKIWEISASSWFYCKKFFDLLSPCFHKYWYSTKGNCQYGTTQWLVTTSRITWYGRTVRLIEIRKHRTFPSVRSIAFLPPRTVAGACSYILARADLSAVHDCTCALYCVQIWNNRKWMQLQPNNITQTGPDWGNGRPGSCPGAPTCNSAKTSLELLEMWC